MLPTTFYSAGLQIEAAKLHDEAMNEEQQAQRNGHPIQLPTLRDRILLQTGYFLIKEGRKLTMASAGHGHLKEEVA